MRRRPEMVGIAVALLLALAPSGLAMAGDMLGVGDAAPQFMLYSYNETESRAVCGSTTPGLGHFLGVSPEHPKQAVLLVFLDKGSSAELDALAKLQRKFDYQGQGLQVVVVGVAREAVDMHDAISSSKGVTFPVLRDRFQIVAGRYGVERGDAPVAYLLVGERPDVDMTTKEAGALDSAASRIHLAWEPHVRGRWTGSMAAQEEAISSSIQTYVKK